MERLLALRAFFVRASKSVFLSADAKRKIERTIMALNRTIVLELGN